MTLLAGAFVPAHACAQEHSGADIVVTARRQAERQGDVPLVVDVLETGAIGAGGVDGLHALSARVPGFSFEAGWGGFFASPALRGQNQPTPRTLDATGMFVDGVAQANLDAVDTEPLDLERVEVVQGPQSALFGHSSFAGLIAYVPAQPTETLLVRSAIDVGSDDLFGANAIVSGPLTALVKGRLAASWRTAAGTERNRHGAGERLGGFRRLAVAGTLSTRTDSGPFSARLSGRYAETRAGQPPFFTLDYQTYNCGARDPASGVWSYFCGPAPIASTVSVSPDVPDSRSRGGQIALHLTFAAGSLEVQSDSSFYGTDSDAFRDFDGTSPGEVYGVCLTGVNCSGVGRLSVPVVRLQRVDMVLRRSLSARELTQELRLRSTGEGSMTWELGGTAYWTRVQTVMAWGAARGALAGAERFSALVLADPQRVGPPAAINSAVVDDPNTEQVPQADAIETRRTLAIFATADYRLTHRLRLRAEARLQWERLAVDSRRANFTQSFGTTLGARHFHDLTPRFSLDWRPGPGWLLFGSYAKGSRPGGINTIPNLLPAEQTFEPESNWTAEVGAKYAGRGWIRAVRIAAYDIDWRNTQILGFSETPGVAALIQRNTRGIHTQGIEFAAEIAPQPWVQLEFAANLDRPRFKPGSEDPGDRDFCGLTIAGGTSNFCTVRPSTINPGQIVPDISGNRQARAVQTSWAAGLTISPRLSVLPGLMVHGDVSHQGDVFDMNVDGLSWGARTLVGARLSFPLGRLELDIWGTNLGGARYVSYAAPRNPIFYSGIPRPTDLVLGEGRRIGATLRYAP